MESKINKSFCVQPFVNITTRIKGQNNVCCNIKLPDSNIKTETPLAFFNSDRVKSLKDSFLKGEMRSECRLCQYQESKSASSQRTDYNKYYNIKNNQSNEYYEKIIEKIGISKLKNPLYFEFHISNLCNLKCLTCNEVDSSRFHAENKALGISENKDANFAELDQTKIEALESAISDDLLFLDIRGGETLMVPEVKKVLLDVDTQRAEKITLKIQTNGTIMPDKEWTKILQKFKRTKINVSIDAYGDDNHYVRYPSDWNKILATLEHLKENKIKFLINTVVSNLNIMVLDRLFDWIQENNYPNYFYLLYGPSIYQPNNLPKELLDIAKKRLQNVKMQFVNDECNQKLSDLIDSCDDQDADGDWDGFCKEIQMRDTHRKNSITSVMPEIKEYMNAKV